MANLPDPIRVVQLPDGTYTYTDHLPTPIQPTTAPQVVHQHIHQAPPDRTVQRIALGSGIGAGTVAAGVYFGPLLVGALTAIAANLALLAFLATVLAWGVVSVVKSIGGPEGQAAAESIGKVRRGRKGK
ncbi:hypothetical protein GCM10010497_40810 [Streptomyces cinereoruber]|uniref:Uncharacterized protein n=1 Tax=Streptomyces cinereoruber TaxID=67260 RepID=A0AAV4KLM0_9ACTN|nr:DUF6251 family protein [Streptomyces cinereoruber]MBB4159620.1 hypothetical protein [Streptomyces cinereoruber]MBY8818010.1 DUF6251 family protein [Streptomyces cinereoruber]NIH60328.1 hypothetical protein [Streptomyces cinereoruber]QEV33878.1 hypothetical protein CP977_18275 [Streptomyces cinereoruber]GGR33823.1 hypothetical protein GCM10010497_40810 [Streptomyces cinereoruber]